MLYFSASTCGFYDDAINSVIPADARIVTPQRRCEVLNAQAEGAIIAADGNGDPVTLPRAPLSEAELLRSLRSERDARLAASDWSQFADAPLSKAKRAEWSAYRKSLRDLPQTITDFAAVEWPVAPS